MAEAVAKHLLHCAAHACDKLFLLSCLRESLHNAEHSFLDLLKADSCCNDEKQMCETEKKTRGLYLRDDGFGDSTGSDIQYDSTCQDISVY